MPPISPASSRELPFSTAAIANSRRACAASFTRVARRRSSRLEMYLRTQNSLPMANDPPFATLNHFAADLGIPSESDLLRIGIRQAARYLDENRYCDSGTCALLGLLLNRQQHFDLYAHSARTAALGKPPGHTHQESLRRCVALRFLFLWIVERHSCEVGLADVSPRLRTERKLGNGARRHVGDLT